jgi:hypothetical protein
VFQRELESLVLGSGRCRGRGFVSFGKDSFWDTNLLTAPPAAVTSQPRIRSRLTLERSEKTCSAAVVQERPKGMVEITREVQNQPKAVSERLLVLVSSLEISTRRS